MKPIMCAFLVGVSMVAFSLSRVQSAEYSQAFDFPDGTDDLQDGSIIFGSNTSPDGDPVAQVIGGRLQLTRDDTGSTSANFKIPSLGVDATESWAASFDFEVFDTPGGSPPADGFSFNHGLISEGANGSEEGFGTGLSIEFDTWNNGSGEAGHNIAVDRVDVPDGFNEIDVMADGVTRHASIVWFDGNATLRVDDEIIFQGLPTPGYSPDADYVFAFAARTGGATEDLFIDNLLIEAPLSGNPGDFNFDGVVDFADALIMADNFGTGTMFSEGDNNRDGRIDLQDFVQFVEIFGAPAPVAAAHVPEPSSLTMMGLCIGAFVLGLRCKRNKPRPGCTKSSQRTTKLGCCVSLMALSLLFVEWGSVRAAEYSQTFDFPDGTTDLGDGSIIFSSNTNPDGDPAAQVIGGRLQLTRDDTGSTSANFKTPSLGADATQSWTASFDFEVFDEEGGSPPADGFSFNFGPITDDATGSEEGFGVGLSVEFDTWNNGSEEAGHNIAVNGADVTDGFNEIDVIADGITRHAVVVWFEGKATLLVDDDLIFAGLSTPGLAPLATDRFAFAARTGGATEDLFIDNLLIEAPISGNPADFNRDGVVDMADYGILLANYNTAGDRSKGDANFSFNVDIEDFVIFRDFFNAEIGVAAASVPEPSTLLLGLIGLTALAASRRRGGR